MRHAEQGRVRVPTDGWGLVILRALVGGAPLFRVGGALYRLSQERAFRLEEVEGRFVYYMRNAGALTRRLDQIAARQAEPCVEEIGGWDGRGR